jgi:hydrogenase maturation protease
MTAAVGRSETKIVVVGLGNLDRGDDGIGAAVARELAGRLPRDVAVLFGRGDLLSLIEEWAKADALICIDAAAPAGAPGRWHRIDLATGDLPPDRASTSSHDFGVAAAIALARTLGVAPRDIVVFAVEGRSFDAGASMTHEVASAAGEVVEHVIAEVARLRLEPTALSAG